MYSAQEQDGRFIACAKFILCFLRAGHFLVRFQIDNVRYDSDVIMF